MDISACQAGAYNGGCTGSARKDGFTPTYASSLRYFFQAADDELRTIARQDSLFGGLSLAIVDPFFFLRPLCRQLLMVRRDNGWLTWPAGASRQLMTNWGRSRGRIFCSVACFWQPAILSLSFARFAIMS